MITVFSAILLAQTAQVQIVHNSPYPIVDVYVNGSVALENVEYRDNTALLDLPTSLEVGIAPAGGDVIATFPFALAENDSYVVFASGILNDEGHPFNLLASSLEETAQDDNSFALKVLHGVTDAPVVDIYANGNLLVDSLAYGEFQGYLQVPAADYTLDITAHGSMESVASFSAPLSGLGGGSGVVYASGFLSPAETDSAFTLMLVTPSGYSVELPPDESVLSYAQVQIIHNSPYPTVDIHVNGSLALEDVAYRANTSLLSLPTGLEVGIAPADGDVIATFPFELALNGSYVVVASGILNDETHPFGLLASTLDEEAEDENSFALKVMHGVTDAPAVDIYANGNLLVDSLAYGDFQGYLQVPAADYTLDITAHGSSESVASFSAPLSGLGGGSGVVYASGFLSPSETGSTNLSDRLSSSRTDSSFTLILVTPSGYSVELPADETALSNDFEKNNIPSSHLVVQNYPNPFNPVTNINYVIFENSKVQITIYDILGNVVNNLFSGYQSVGSKTIKWDATNNVGDLVGSGIYFYKVQVGESYSINRMMYLK